MPALTSEAGPFAIVPRWIIRHPELKPTSILVYAYLADRADRDTNKTWPGQRRIAEELHLSTKTVNLAIRELENVGALATEKHHRTTTVYTILVVEPTTNGRETYNQTVRESTTHQEPVSTTIHPKPVIAAKPRDEWWDTITEIVGQPSPSQTSLQGRLVTRIKTEGHPPDEIRRRAEKLVAAWGPTKLTLASLEKHWGRFGTALSEMTDRDVADALERREREKQRQLVREAIE